MGKKELPVFLTNLITILLLDLRVISVAVNSIILKGVSCPAPRFPKSLGILNAIFNLSSRPIFY